MVAAALRAPQCNCQRFVGRILRGCCDGTEATLCMVEIEQIANKCGAVRVSWRRDELHGICRSTPTRFVSGRSYRSCRRGVKGADSPLCRDNSYRIVQVPLSLRPERARYVASVLPMMNSRRPETGRTGRVTRRPSVPPGSADEPADHADPRDDCRCRSHRAGRWRHIEDEWCASVEESLATRKTPSPRP